MAGVLFDDDSAQRIAQATVWAERERSVAHDHEPTAPPSWPIMIARITSASADGNGNYPAVITAHAGVSNSWTDYSAVKVKPLNGETLTNGTRYGVRAAGRTAGGDELYVTAHLVGGGGGGITLREVDGSPSFAVTTLELNQADGAQVVDMTGGVGRLNWLSASITQKGIVDLSAQSFKGRKTFRDIVHFDPAGNSGVGFAGGFVTGYYDTLGSSGLFLGDGTDHDLLRIIRYGPDTQLAYFQFQNNPTVPDPNGVTFSVSNTTGVSVGIADLQKGGGTGFNGTVPNRPICRAGWVVGSSGVVGAMGDI